jgi:hypothetical protein
VISLLEVGFSMEVSFKASDFIDFEPISILLEFGTDFSPT